MALGLRARRRYALYVRGTQDRADDSVQNVGGTAPYAASKGGVAALTRTAAIDLASAG